MSSDYSNRKHASNVILQTLQLPWIEIGTIPASANGKSVLGEAARTFQVASALANTVYWLVPYGVNAAAVRFLLTLNGADVDIDVYLGRLSVSPGIDSSADCSLQRICTLDIVCGEQQYHANTSLLFADTINVSNDATIQGIGTSVPGDSHMATMHFDLRGHNLVLFHGYGTFDKNCTIHVTGY